METIVTRQNQPFLVYNQGPALYLLPLPLISPARPKMIARDFQSSLTCSTLEEELIFLYENTMGQIVLLFHNPGTGQQRYLPLLSPSPDESYQDFFLWPVQGRLYFFYTVYTPFDGRCRLFYKLPLEYLESRPAEDLEATHNPIFTDCSVKEEKKAAGTKSDEREKKAAETKPNEGEKKAAEAKSDETDREDTLQEMQRMVQSEEELSRISEEYSEAKNALEENQRKIDEMETTIEHISAQYQELYDYTLALQKEARKWRDLAQNRLEKQDSI